MPTLVLFCAHYGTGLAQSGIVLGPMLYRGLNLQPMPRCPKGVGAGCADTACSRLGNGRYGGVQVIAKRSLRQFWERHNQAELPLRAWHATASAADWSGPADVKAAFGRHVDFVGDNRLVFDIAGNTSRLVVHAAYPFRRLLIKFVGTHAEYDKIDVETV